VNFLNDYFFRTKQWVTS